MNNHDEWDEFLRNLFNNALEKHQKTKAYKSTQKKHSNFEEILYSNIPLNKKQTVDEYFFDMMLETERETEALYRQGLKDCVFLLKEIGALA